MRYDEATGEFVLASGRAAMKGDGVGIPEPWSRRFDSGTYVCESCGKVLARECFEWRVVSCRCAVYFPRSQRTLYNSGPFAAGPDEFIDAYLAERPIWGSA